MSKRVDELKLSDEIIEKITADYDNNEIKTEDIVKKYNLDIPVNQLYKLVLPETLEEKCECCSASMIKKRIRAENKRNYAYCLECGHSKAPNCDCPKCETKKKEYEIRMQKEEQVLIDLKIKVIKEIWCQKKEEVDYDDLTLIQKVNVGILLNSRAEYYENVICQLRYSRGALLPNAKDVAKMISELLKYNILTVIPEFSLKGFSDYGTKIINYKDVFFKINIRCDDMECLKKLKLGQIKLHDYEFLMLWRYIAYQEVLQNLLYRMKEVGFDDFNPGVKTDKLINNMLETLSVSECFCLIKSSVKNSVFNFVKKKNNKKRVINSVITRCESYLIRAKNEGWKFRWYGWPSDLERSIASTYIYNDILKIGDIGITCRPMTRTELTEKGICDEL